jgi:hypothetical protein
MTYKPAEFIYWPAHDVLPPLQLMYFWKTKYTDEGHTTEWVLRHVARRAAQWGADRELELCAIYLDSSTAAKTAEELVFARRKPPSLKEQALEDLDLLVGVIRAKGLGVDETVIRRALEALPN